MKKTNKMSTKMDYCIIDMYKASQKIEVVVHSQKKIHPENILLSFYKSENELEYEPIIKIHKQPVSINISIKMN